MVEMIETELEEIETIQRELDNNAITLSDVDNRWETLFSWYRTLNPCMKAGGGRRRGGGHVGSGHDSQHHH